MKGELLANACHTVNQYDIVNRVLGCSLLTERLKSIFPSASHLVNLGDGIATIFAQFFLGQSHRLVGLAHAGQIIDF